MLDVFGDVGALHVIVSLCAWSDNEHNTKVVFEHCLLWPLLGGTVAIVDSSNACRCSSPSFGYHPHIRIALCQS